MIKKYWKPAIVGFVLFVSLCCVLFALVSNKPQNNTAPVNKAQPTKTTEPTITNTPTPNTFAYKVKLLGWLNDFQSVNDVVMLIVSNKHVSEVDIRRAGMNLDRIKTELHATIPPPEYAKTHAQLTEAIDWYHAAIQDFGDGKLSAGLVKLKKAEALFSTLTDTLPTPTSNA